MKYTHCINPECGYPLRSARRTEAELPGTRAHGAGGLCRPCYDRQKTAGKRAERAALEPMRGRESIREGFDLDHSIYALNSWIANLPSRKVRA